VSAAATLLAQAVALRAQADALEALAATLPEAADELLGVVECSDRYAVGRDALRGAALRGELAVTRGARGKLLVRRSALEAWLTSRPLQANDASDGEWSPDARAS
jgi:hypothetical protein